MNEWLRRRKDGKAPLTSTNRERNQREGKVPTAYRPVCRQLRSVKGKEDERKVQAFNVQLKNRLNLLSLSHESNIKDEKKKTKQKNR